MMRLPGYSRNDKIGLFFFVALIISTSLIWMFEERFDETLWSTEPSNRHKMVDDLMESQILMDKTTDEVIMLLGEPNSSLSEEKDIYLYRLGKPPSFFKTEREQLMIIFELNKVSKVTLVVEE